MAYETSLLRGLEKCSEQMRGTINVPCRHSRLVDKSGRIACPQPQDERKPPLSTKNPTLLLANELLNRAQRPSDLREFSAANAIAGPHYAEATGWHIYTHLGWPVRISAAEIDKDAQAYLGLLQVYATLAERAGRSSGLHILEVQGKRLHLFLDAAHPLPDDLQRIVVFGRVLQRLIDQYIRPQVDSSRLAFTVATDHGAAILVLSTNEDQSESLVSLGHAANTPAKKLNRGVTAGHLAFDKNVFNPGATGAIWEEINLEVADNASLKSKTELALANSRTDLDAALIENREAQLKTFAASFIPQPQRSVQDPLVYQGFMFRADLDGFSERVRKAMAGTAQDKLRLVMEFTEIMQFPSEFKDRLEGKARVLPFPWAGDCANLLLVPDDYDFARTFLPNLAATEWHAQRNQTNRARQPWSTYLAQNRWVVGVAGGDNGDSDHGRVLVGRVIANQRTYLVGGGWGWGRSDDAVQAEGVKAEETVITREDHQGLSVHHQAAYRPLDSRFHHASLDALNKSKDRAIKARGASKPFHIRTPVAAVTMPSPRPYAR